MMKRTSRVQPEARNTEAEIPSPPHLHLLVSLEEIDHWLARYRDLVRSVEGSAQEQIAAVMSQLEAHRRLRRAELA